MRIYRLLIRKNNNTFAKEDVKPPIPPNNAYIDGTYFHTDKYNEKNVIDAILNIMASIIHKYLSKFENVSSGGFVIKIWIIE